MEKKDEKETETERDRQTDRQTGRQMMMILYYTSLKIKTQIDQKHTKGSKEGFLIRQSFHYIRQDTHFKGMSSLSNFEHCQNKK